MRERQRIGPLIANLCVLAGVAISGPSAAQSHQSPPERSVCEIDYFGNRLDQIKQVRVTGEVLRILDGYGLYMTDHEHCSDNFMAVRIPSRYPIDSGIGDLVTAVFGTGRAKKNGKYLHCVCEGSLKYRNGMVVMDLTEVQRLWVD